MLRVVTTNNVEVFRHLGAGPFQRLDVKHAVATDFDDALAKVRSVQPKIAIIDVDLAGGSGYELCKQIKADPALAGVHVMMVLSSVISRDALTELDSSGCDDVLAVPIHADDFYHHIAQIAGLPLRRDRRIGARLELVLPNAELLTGIVENVSGGGAGVVVDGPLSAAQEVTARIIHEGHEYPDIHALVAWARPSEDDASKTNAGLTFEEVPMKTRLLLERMCLFDIQRTPRGITVSLYGDFTEIIDFSALAGRLQSENDIDFYMRAVRYISSAGVRAWCNFLGTLAGKRYSFRHCSIAFASQAAMVPMSIGEGEVVSLEAPYRCESCDRDDLRLLETKTILVDGANVLPPALKCTTCGDDLEFDDVPNRYFAFLRPEPT